MYLNSDLRSDTGLKLAKEVSRCLCIQDTAPPWILRTPFVPKEGTMRATARPAFHRNHHCPSGGGGSVEKLFSPARKLELLRIFIPIFSSPFFVCIYIYVYLECGTNSTKRSHYGIISSVLYRLFIPFVILFDYFIPVLNPRTLNTPPSNPQVKTGHD